jgi:hypothetical protein
MIWRRPAPGGRRTLQGVRTVSIGTRFLTGIAALAVSATALADGSVAVPEPGTLGLLVAGLAGVLAARRIGRK